jgi:hypothetical protein
MSGQIVFLSLFLGLVSGPQPIDLHVVDPIQSVRILVDGREVKTLSQPPWHAVLDFGKDIVPRELVAVGYDSNGNEVGRAVQILNVPRPTADFEIVLEPRNAAAALRFRHLANARPKKAAMTVDGTPLRVDKNLRAVLPALDPEVPHVIAAQIEFDDGFIARRELVLAGGVSDNVGSQLTPIAVRANRSDPPPSFEDCFSMRGAIVRTAAVEKPLGLVIIVQDPDPRSARLLAGLWGRDSIARTAIFGSDTAEEILWPIAKRFVDVAQTSLLFEHTNYLDAATHPVVSILTTAYAGAAPSSEPLQFADAVAVAGVKAVAGGLRRAVILVAGSESPDASRHDPLVVRRYLDSIGVPLFVWSLHESPELAAAWGDVEEITSAGDLRRAVDHVRAALNSQRIAWVAVDPLTALRLTANPRCGMALLVRPAS